MILRYRGIAFHINAAVLERYPLRRLGSPAQRHASSIPKELLHASRSVWAQIFLYTALIAGAASQIRAQDRLSGDVSPIVVRAKIEA